MSQPFLGEVRMFAGNFAPRSWMFCNGQLLAIAQYQALFSLLGTTFGGNGTTNFALPNLQSTIAVGEGTGPGLTPRVLGQTGGTETVTLTTSQIPSHMHALMASTTPAVSGGQAPSATVVLGTPSVTTGVLYTANTGSPAPSPGVLVGPSVSQMGGNQPHNNLMPTLCISFIIAAQQGIFPSRN